MKQYTFKDGTKVIAGSVEEAKAKHKVMAAPIPSGAKKKKVMHGGSWGPDPSERLDKVLPVSFFKKLGFKEDDLGEFVLKDNKDILAYIQDDEFSLRLYYDEYNQRDIFGFDYDILYDKAKDAGLSEEECNDAIKKYAGELKKWLTDNLKVLKKIKTLKDIKLLPKAPQFKVIKNAKRLELQKKIKAIISQLNDAIDLERKGDIEMCRTRLKWAGKHASELAKL